MKINNFRGDLTDISAKKKALESSKGAHHHKAKAIAMQGQKLWA